MLFLMLFLTNLLLSTEDEKNKAIKLYHQLCHASKDQLIKLLKDSGCADKAFLRMIVDCCDNCKFCLKFKEPLSKSVVRFPVLDRFSKYVSVDLKKIDKEKAWILHLTDAAKKYTASCFIIRKKKELIVCCIFQIWRILEHFLNFIAIVAENLQVMYSMK